MPPGFLSRFIFFIRTENRIPDVLLLPLLKFLIERLYKFVYKSNLFVRTLTEKYKILDSTIHISFYHMSSTCTGITTKYKHFFSRENFLQDNHILRDVVRRTKYRVYVIYPRKYVILKIFVLLQTSE